MTGQQATADDVKCDCVFSMHERDYLKDPRGALAKAREYAMVRVYGDDGLIFALLDPASDQRRGLEAVTDEQAIPADIRERIAAFERILASEANPRVTLGGTPEPVVWYKLGGDLYEMPMAEFVQIVARATKANQ